MNIERIQRELARLADGGQAAELFDQAPRPAVLYKAVPTAGPEIGLPPFADVVVPVPSGHPSAVIDLAGLELGSPFLPRVKGGLNSQGVIVIGDRHWQLASYHPHNGGGGAPFDPQRHGFDTYFGELLAWLHRLH